MSVTQTFTCDRCGRKTMESGIVTHVEVTYGGCGAARDKVDGIDLCRECYGQLINSIKSHTSPLPTPLGATMLMRRRMD